MWLDIAVAAVFVFSTAMGIRKGFVQTFIHAAGWLLALVIGYATYSPVAEFLKTKTGLFDYLQLKVATRLNAQGGDSLDSFINALPHALGETVEAAKFSIATTIASGITDFLFNLLSFLLVALAIRFLLYLLSALLSKKHRGGVTGAVDGFFGLLAGALKGILVIFLLLALMVPYLGISGNETLTAALEDSAFAGMLYDNNPIFLALHDFF